jgi:MFS family permease
MTRRKRLIVTKGGTTVNGVTSFMKRLGARAWRALKSLAAPAWRALKTRWYLQCGLVLIVALALAWTQFSGRERIIAVAFLALGGAIMSWPGIRRGLRRAGKLGLDAALEGVASTSFKFGILGVRVVVTTLAVDLSTSQVMVMQTLVLAGIVSVVTNLITVAVLDRRPDAVPPRFLVWACFGSMAFALGLIAIAQDPWVLIPAAILMGAPPSVNTLFRDAAMSQYPGKEGLFTAIAGTAGQVTQIAGGAALGLLATVLGWRWAFAAAAIVVALLGILVALRRPRADPDKAAERTTLRSRLSAALARLPARPTRADVKRRLGNALQRSLRPWPHPPVLGKRPGAARTLWDVESVRRHLITSLTITAIVEITRTSLEPLLVDAGLGDNRALLAAWILATAQLAPLGYVARLAKGSNRSPRQVAVRSALVLLPAAPFALAGLIPIWWLAVPSLWILVMLVETASGGNSSASRVALRRHDRLGQLGSVLGQTFGNIGYAVGTFGAAMLTLLPSGWLAPVLLAGAVLAVCSTFRKKRRCVNHDAKTKGRELTFQFRWDDGEHHVKCQLPPTTDGTRLAPYELTDGDTLDGHSRNGDQEMAERKDVLGITVTAGDPWWEERQLARWMGDDVLLSGRLWRSLGWFTSEHFSVKVRWRTAGVLRCVAVPVEGGLDLHLTLRERFDGQVYDALDEEFFKEFDEQEIRWQLDRGVDHSDQRSLRWDCTSAGKRRPSNVG